MKKTRKGPNHASVSTFIVQDIAASIGLMSFGLLTSIGQVISGIGNAFSGVLSGILYTLTMTII